jgi:DNA polymerase-4
MPETLAASMEYSAAILHADLDAFYASVEQLLHPSLRGKPVAVGGGVVLAASYEARAFGVKGGMNGRRARELCPDLIFTGGHFDEYQRLGDAAINIVADFTPDIERISIDEAFADVSGSTQLFGSPEDIARRVRTRVRDELGLPISIGVARTKHLAKIGSQVAKPDGLVVIAPATELEFLHDLPVDLMWGVGPATKQKLAAKGITTIGQLAHASPDAMERVLGRANGRKLTQLAWNKDPRPIQTHRRAVSAGAQSALGRRPATENVLAPVLQHLADRIARRLRAKDRPARTVTVRVRFSDMRAVTRALMLPAPIQSTSALAEVAIELVRSVLADNKQERSISLLAISASNLGEDPFPQLELPFLLADDGLRPGAKKGAQRVRADRALDAIRDRFGIDAVGYAAGQLRAPRSKGFANSQRKNFDDPRCLGRDRARIQQARAAGGRQHGTRSLEQKKRWGRGKPHTGVWVQVHVQRACGSKERRHHARRLVGKLTRWRTGRLSDCRSR